MRAKSIGAPAGAAGVGGPRQVVASLPATPETRDKPPVAALALQVRGVLYDDSGWRRWLLQLLSHMGLHTHYTCFFRVWEREYLPDVDGGRRDYWEALRAFLISAGMSTGQIDEVEASGYAQRRRFEENVRPLPGVRATLIRLAAQGVQLAAVCNSAPSQELAAEQLRQLRLADQFPIFIAGSTPAGCGDPRGRFQALLAQMRLAARHVAFVGCDSRELAAAEHVGLQTVAFNHDGDAHADYYLEHFDQLLCLLCYQPVRLLAG